jgi:hypothetical protein
MDILRIWVLGDLCLGFDTRRYATSMWRTQAGPRQRVYHGWCHCVSLSIRQLGLEGFPEQKQTFAVRRRQAQPLRRRKAGLLRRSTLRVSLLGMLQTELETSSHAGAEACRVMTHY